MGSAPGNVTRSDQGPSGPNLRARRSRKDRPCDRCRRMKQLCHIPVRGEACTLCKRTNRDCTFVSTPTTRRRRAGRDTSTLSKNISPDSTDISNSIPIFVQDAIEESSVEQSSITVGGGSSVEPKARSKALSDFMDCLASENQPQDYEPHHESLDMDVADEEEFQYLGAGAFALLTMAGADPACHGTGVGDGLRYRQVADKKRPVFFLKNPSKVYGQQASGDNPEDRALAKIMELMRVQPIPVPELVKQYATTIWPSLPIFNRARFEAACLTLPGSGPRPTVLLVGIITMMAVSMPGPPWSLCKESAEVLLNLLESGYWQPRLHTIQLALLDLFGRPVLTPGGNHTAICRAIGCAQVLGLHRDCSSWRLPSWEKSLRKRLWWCLCIVDKWNSFVYDRPSNIHDLCAVPIPAEVEGDSHGSESQYSLAPFVATCHLTVILSDLLPLSSPGSSMSPAHKTATLRRASDALANMDTSRIPARTYSFHLSRVMVATFICQLGLDMHDELTVTQLVRAADNAHSVVEEGVEILESLEQQDYSSFWPPWASYQISHSLALLLRVILVILARPEPTPPGAQHATKPSSAVQEASRPIALEVVRKASDLARRLVTVVKHTQSTGWEIADAAMGRVMVLIRSSPKVPEIKPLRALVGLPDDDVAPSHTVEQEHAHGPGMNLDAAFPLDWDSEFPNSLEEFLSFLS